MLDDRDRERLREIQRRFMNEDPAFVREFGARPKQSEGSAQRGDVFVICIVSLMALSVFTMLAGWPAPAALFAFLAGLAWVAQSRADDH